MTDLPRNGSLPTNLRFAGHEHVHHTATKLLHTNVSNRMGVSEVWYLL
jgi:hypothetical protein